MVVVVNEDPSGGVSPVVEPGVVEVGLEPIEPELPVPIEPELPGEVWSVGAGPVSAVL